MIQIISLSSAIALCLILESSHSKVAFDIGLKSQFILLFNLFLLLFMSPTELFGIIHGSYFTISANFLPLSIVFSAKNFQFQLNKLFPNGH